MTKKDLENAEKLARERGLASANFKGELQELIKQAGYDETEKTLEAFARLGGGTEAGISSTKLKWVLDFGIRPREDF